MTAVYNAAGAYLANIPIISAAGAVPIAAVTNGFFTAVLPVAGVWTAVTIAAQPDVPRNVTFLVTDADSGIASAYLEVTGTDAQDRVLMETLSFGGGGTATITGTLCFKTITSARFIAAATVSGADTLTGGYGNILGIKYDAGAVTNVKNRRKDSTAAVGTILIPAGTHCTWTLSGGDVPNAARAYFYDFQSTA